MTKAALIILENDKNVEESSILRSIINKTFGFIEVLIPNKIERIDLPSENFSLDIVKIPRIVGEGKRLESRLKKLSKWIQKEGISLLAFDEDIENNPILVSIFKKSSVEVSYRSNIFFSFEIRVLKSLLKSKGLDIKDTDTVIVSNGTSKYETGYIKYLSTCVKYLTYVSSNINIEGLIDDLFNDFGFSIRVCSNIKDCIEEAGLVINLTNDEVIPKGAKLKNRLVVRNIVGKLSNSNNVTVLNEINIDISSRFKIQTKIENKYKYKICELYVLTKLGKLYLLKQFAEENDLKVIHECIKNEGFKTTGLNGKNI